MSQREWMRYTGSEEIFYHKEETWSKMKIEESFRKPDRVSNDEHRNVLVLRVGFSIRKCLNMFNSLSRQVIDEDQLSSMLLFEERT